MRKPFHQLFSFGCTSLGAMAFGFGAFLTSSGVLWRLLGESYDQLAWIPWVASAIGASALAMYLLVCFKHIRFRYRVPIMLCAGLVTLIGGTYLAPIAGCTDEGFIREHALNAELEYFKLIPQIKRADNPSRDAVK